MLKKLKKKFKQQKGFTLVELLAVIAILGIIVAIAVPTIGNIVSNSEEDALKANEELITNAARLAHVSGLTFSNNDTDVDVDNVTDAGDDNYYTVDHLVDAGFLDSVPDAVGNNGSYDNTYVKVVEDDGTGGIKFEFNQNASS
ncbi:type II secretion system protein [Ornithinibacillus halophilus]|uniref:Type IV pilus assembly protein PilA n=1 Tax=Ornithinibacillus halophilus TaxID=930117 RepID=A0A1M5EI82_9BACI|nr:type II secretion system protein [Ornithinibacillus halophilus]SHF78762.1 type IV pilus assembly protein PilA [Ornithinibacillus halophilus]